MTATNRRTRRLVVVAGTSLALAGAYFASSASAVSPTCDGQQIDYYVPEGGALFEDPAGNAGSVIYGTNGADWIRGLGGNDTICGLDGNDFLQGGKQDDYLEGGDNADEMHGGEGTDTLYGFAGANDIACGDGGGDFADGGADVGAENDTLLPNDGCEVFVGF